MFFKLFLLIHALKEFESLEVSHLFHCYFELMRIILFCLCDYPDLKLFQ